jgi:DTW domain-containing protein YfiP
MTKRILCQCCQRPEKACICPFITPVNNNIHVVVLQHPSEISQAKGTVALLAKSLHSCQVIVGEDFTNNEPLHQILTQYQGLLLYPNEKAQVLSGSLMSLLKNNALQTTRDSMHTNKKAKPYCLIILDGTWKKAYKMLMLSQTLQQLTSVCLPESLANTGQYHIRKVAKKNALSSLEACCHALSLLENSDKYQPLLTKFNDFNQFQLSFRPQDHLTTHQTNVLGKN